MICQLGHDDVLLSKSYLYSMIITGLQSSDKDLYHSACSLLSVILSQNDNARVRCSYHHIDSILIHSLHDSPSTEALDCLLFLVKGDVISIETRNSRIRQILEMEHSLSILVEELNVMLVHFIKYRPIIKRKN